MVSVENTYSIALQSIQIKLICSLSSFFQLLNSKSELDVKFSNKIQSVSNAQGTSLPSAYFALKHVLYHLISFIHHSIWINMLVGNSKKIFYGEIRVIIGSNNTSYILAPSLIAESTGTKIQPTLEWWKVNNNVQYG